MTSFSTFIYFYIIQTNYNLKIDSLLPALQSRQTSLSRVMCERPDIFLQTLQLKVEMCLSKPQVAII